MSNLTRTPLLLEGGAFRHLGRIERDASPEQQRKLLARKKYLDQRQNLRFARSRGEADPKKLRQFGIDPDVPEGEHPSSVKKHYPSDYRSSTGW